MAQSLAGEASVQTRRKRKGVRLTCPHCGYRVGDASPDIKMIIRSVAEDPQGSADLYIKCGRCKAELAARKIE